MERYAQERAGSDAPGTTVGTVPGTVPGVVRIVVLCATWGLNLTAKPVAFRLAVRGSNAMVTRKLTCRWIYRISAEATWKAYCRASRGLTSGPVSAVVCAVTRAAIYAASREYRSPL